MSESLRGRQPLERKRVQNVPTYQLPFSDTKFTSRNVLVTNLMVWTFYSTNKMFV